MRLINVAIAAFAVGSVAAVAFAQGSEPVPFGHFYRLPPKLVKGRTIWPRTNDTVDISRLPGDRAMVKIDLKLGDAACSFAGIARFEGRELVYRDEAGDPNSACLLAFTKEEGRLTWRDNGRCSARCPSSGMTGDLPLRHRSAAVPAAKLEGYEAALAEWRGATGG